MKTTTRLLTLFVLGMIVASGCAVSQTYSEEELGLRKTDLYTEKNTLSDKTAYSTLAAGEAPVIKRAFENAPPMIPHDVEGLLPITKDSNSCTGCHLPEVAEAVKATPMPKSHFFDMRTQKVLTSMSEARYNCTQCHAPQSNNAPLVKNEFQPDFRSANGSVRSNLLDTLNEGVK
jgi:cytochrome c-type protein NapB